MILNYTSFTADTVAGWDHRLEACEVIILSAAFEAKPGGAIRVAELPANSHPTDVCFGERGKSSVRYEADIATEKPRVDVLVNGHAYAPGGRKTNRVRVSIRVGSVFKELVVTGDRFRIPLLGLPSSPRPFVTLPLVLERAYGGTVRGWRGIQLDVRNPFGVGYKGAKSLDPSVETEFPNVQYPGGLQKPACFGVVPRQCQPRLKLSGTYDDAWLTDRWPQLPADFNPEYHQAAPLDQQSSVIAGGELVELLNMTPEGVWRFRLPKLKVPVHLWYADRGETATLRLDTIILEPEAYRVTLKARVKIPIMRNRAPLRQAILGHITRGWWRSRLSRKVYRDPFRLKGRERAPCDYEA